MLLHRLDINDYLLLSINLNPEKETKKILFYYFILLTFSCIIEAKDKDRSHEIGSTNNKMTFNK